MELTIRQLTKKYGSKTALDHVDLSLQEGIYGLLGPNGAGKSTLMKIITDNLRADSGEVLMDGVPALKMGADFRRLLGYMPQQQGIYENFTARRFLYYIAALKGMEKRRADKEVEEVAALVNLSNELDKRLGSYSGGMKQRILIAQAVLGSPKVLIFDEPTAGLDPKERIRIRNLISEIALDRIVIIATHVVSDIEFIAREILLLKEGKLIAKERPSALLKTVENQVFEIAVEEEDLPEVQKRYRVGNICRDEEDTIWVRVITEKEPEGFRLRKPSPTLEDVYLHVFEE